MTQIASGSGQPAAPAPVDPTTIRPAISELDAGDQIEGLLARHGTNFLDADPNEGREDEAQGRAPSPRSAPEDSGTEEAPDRSPTPTDDTPDRDPLEGLRKDDTDGEEDDGPDEDLLASLREPSDKEDSEKTETEGAPPPVEAAQLASILGVDPEHLQVTDDGTVMVRFKAEDDVGFAPLAELQKGYQTARYNGRQSETLAEERKAIQTERLHAKQQLDDAVVQATATAQAAREVLEAEAHALERIAESDPETYAAKRLQLNDRMSALDQRVGALVAGYEQQQKEALEKFAAEQQELQRASAARLKEREPLLFDETKGPRIQKAMRQYLGSVGFNDQEINGLYDDRMYSVIMDALRYRATRDKVDPAKKRVAVVPKVMKPGAPPTATEQRQEQDSLVIGRLKKSGSEKDAAAAFMHRGIV